jgi:pimeloyl-ACP methyl ester carboxylesterase
MKRFFIYILFISIIIGFNALQADEKKAEYQVMKGEIKGAKFMIALPRNWNNNLLMLAHGYIPPGTPLTADFPIEKSFYQHLLSKGWMIAYSSFRRSGVIIKDAVEDMNLLRRHIIAQFREPEKIIVLGTSMGATIGTLIAEAHPNDYDAVLNLGAAFSKKIPEETVTFTYNPKIPILFLGNQNELQSPKKYLKLAAKASIPPILWYVSRDGHVNISELEKEGAFLALDSIIATGRRLRNNHDATIQTGSMESNAAFKDGGAYAKVKSIHPAFGNLETEFIEKDLNALGIVKKTYFQLIFKDKTLKVFYGTAYSDVPKGEWIALLTANGTIEIARNFKNAGDTLGCKKGDRIFIKK